MRGDCAELAFIDASMALGRLEISDKWKSLSQRNRDRVRVTLDDSIALTEVRRFTISS